MNKFDFLTCYDVDKYDLIDYTLAEIRLMFGGGLIPSPMKKTWTYGKHTIEFNSTYDCAADRIECTLFIDGDRTQNFWTDNHEQI